MAAKRRGAASRHRTPRWAGACRVRPWIKRAWHLIVAVTSVPVRTAFTVVQQEPAAGAPHARTCCAPRTVLLALHGERTWAGCHGAEGRWPGGMAGAGACRGSRPTRALERRRSGGGGAADERLKESRARLPLKPTHSPIPHRPVCMQRGLHPLRAPPGDEQRHLCARAALQLALAVLEHSRAA